MNTDVIETIVTVSRCKSFLEAADMLYCSPSVVSKRIAKAEDELGVKLFRRGNKSSTVRPTPECDVLIADFESMMGMWSKISQTARALTTERRTVTLRVGTVQKRWSYGEAEAISEFMVRYPNVEIEQILGYSVELLSRLKTGQLDATFVVGQKTEGADESEIMKLVAEDDSLEAFLVNDIRQMYLAVGANSPMGGRVEATFDEFRDYEIAFNSDKRAIACKDNMRPFVLLSQQYGFDLKPTFLNTWDASAYRLAMRENLAIPVPNNDFQYSGISYVKLTDWPSCVSSYIVIHKDRMTEPIRNLIAIARETE
jgi:DNA-binding transcriptional LysR family regulator